MNKLIKLPEPTLLFDYDQATEDPRDGLTLFGPLDAGRPYGIRAGVIGTKDGRRKFKNWVKKIQGPISNSPPKMGRPPFSGFETVFHIPWKPEPDIEIDIPEQELQKAVYLDDRHQRVYKTVDEYLNRIERAIREEETKVDIWFVIVPDYVHQYCRPNSFISSDLRVEADSRMPVKRAKKLQFQPSLFAKENEDAVPYHYEVNFHNQLKARLLKHDAPTQIIRESTIAPDEFLNKAGKPKRKLDVLESSIAWNISTATFYKAGGRPWKLGNIRDGVCYIGLVFKKDEKYTDARTACCAAQMFLDSGDGVVFKGAVGPWYSPKRGDYHLNRAAAKELVELAVRSYKDKKNGQPPKELFLHGQVMFHQNEWCGFKDAVDSSTNLVGIRIRDDRDFKLYRKGDHPVLRGLAHIEDERTAYLWSNGYVPRLQTYPGLEVPKPLRIDISKGNADMEVVLNDILALTKLNYNSCRFSDGKPVTLKFADAVGEILTAGPVDNKSPLPFKHYI